MSSFCVEGPSVIDFVATASWNTPSGGLFGMSLEINGVPVALAQFSDLEAPSDMTILYRGRITEDSQVSLLYNNEASESYLDPL